MTRERTLQPPDPGEHRAIARRDFLHPARDIEAITVNRWPHGYAPEYNPLFDPDTYEERRVNLIGRAKLRWDARLQRGPRCGPGCRPARERLESLHNGDIAVSIIE